MEKEPIQYDLLVGAEKVLAKIKKAKQVAQKGNEGDKDYFDITYKKKDQLIELAKKLFKDIDIKNKDEILAKFIIEIDMNMGQDNCVNIILNFLNIHLKEEKIKRQIMTEFANLLYEIIPEGGKYAIGSKYLEYIDDEQIKNFESLKAQQSGKRLSR